MNTSEFENLIRKQPLRRAPADLRAQVLSGVGPKKSHGFRRWTDRFIWPCRPAWGLLAAAWVVILCLRMGTPVAVPAAGSTQAKSTPTVPFREQRKFLADILSREAPVASLPPRAYRPRGENSRPRPTLV